MIWGVKMAEDSPGSSTGFRPRFHPDRALIYAETHARPVLPVEAPVRIRRVAFMTGNGGKDLAQVQVKMAELASMNGHDGTAAAGQLAFTVNGRKIVWERHSEFSTLTWTSPPDDWQAWPPNIGLEFHGGLELMVATRLDLTDAPSISSAALAGFDELSLCYSEIFDGTAQAAADFVADADGFNRFEVAVGGAGALRRGVIVRRLLEIETYRNFALLGLPLARISGAKIETYEAELEQMMRQVSEHWGSVDNQAALDALHDLSLKVENTVGETRFRFAAGRAYGDILGVRLDRLAEISIGEFATIKRYIDNRVVPALSTCEAMAKRLEALTATLGRATELLAARISLGIQKQNQSVLDTISATSQSQYRLQRTVEGLSIIAISYYAVAMIGYLVAGLHEAIHVDKEMAQSIAVPFVVVTVWWMIHRLRRPGEGKSE